MASMFPRIISADSHVIEPRDLWWKALGKKFGDRTPRVIEEFRGVKGPFFWVGPGGDEVGRLGALDREIKASGGRRMWESGFIPEVRVACQREDGIDSEMINSTYMLSILQCKDREVVRACAEVYNDWLAEFCSYDPKRLLGAPVVPADDIEWAEQELEKVARWGMRTIMINVDVPEGIPPYRNRTYDPFWAAVQDLGIPITLHIAAGRAKSEHGLITPEEAEEAPWSYVNIFSEIQGVLANEFIFGGILDRFPDLRLLYSEYEISWVPWFMYLFDHRESTLIERVGLPKPRMRPSEYMRTRAWGVLGRDLYARVMIPLIGAERVLWGSDYPHPVDTVGVAEIAELLRELPREDQEKIVCGNAIKLFAL